MISSLSKIAFTALIMWMVTAATAKADENSLQDRTLTGNSPYTCGVRDLRACYVRDLSTQNEYRINFQGITYYKVDPYDKYHKGYSIRCVVASSVSFLNFKADNKYQKFEYKAPYWMAGDSYGKPAPVHYLKQCGRKYISVQGYDKFKKVCFLKKFWIEAKCDKKQCPYGQIFQNGKCIKKVPQCPYGQVFDAYKKICVKKNGVCNYKCPQYATYKRGYVCRGNIYDCECFKGYKMVYQNNKYFCKKIQISGKTCNYKCPLYSKRLPNRSCYDTFDDCFCIRGYYKKNGKCVRSLEI